jgi:hypothetical protein
VQDSTLDHLLILNQRDLEKCAWNRFLRDPAAKDTGLHAPSNSRLLRSDYKYRQESRAGPYPGHQRRRWCRGNPAAIGPSAPVKEGKLSSLLVGSENIRFCVREQSKQTIEKGGYYDRHVYSPKGKLSFILDEHPRRAWHEGKAKRLEEELGEIVVGTFQFGEVLRADRLKWEERHRPWEEERRLRELQKEARKKEDANERTFRAEVRKWNIRKMMREYIAERERALDKASLEPARKQKALEWMAWAKGYVDRVDPLKRGFVINEA